MNPCRSFFPELLLLACFTSTLPGVFGPCDPGACSGRANGSGPGDRRRVERWRPSLKPWKVRPLLKCCDLTCVPLLKPFGPKHVLFYIDRLRSQRTDVGRSKFGNLTFSGAKYRKQKVNTPSQPACRYWTFSEVKGCPKFTLSPLRSFE